MVTIDGTEIAGATIDGEVVVEITVDGDVVWVAISTLMEIFSGTAYNGQKVEFSLSGNSGASSLTFTGVETTASGSASDYNSGGSFTANVGGNQSPTSESITIEGSGSTSSQSQNYYNTNYINDTIYPSNPYSESVSVTPKTGYGDQLSSAGGSEYNPSSQLWETGSGAIAKWGVDRDTMSKFDSNGNADWSYTPSSNSARWAGHQGVGVFVETTDPYDFEIIDSNGTLVSTGSINYPMNAGTTADKDFVIVGTRDFDYGGELLKLDSSGGVYTLELFYGTSNDEQVPMSIAIDDSKNIYVALRNAEIRKFDSSGSQQWNVDTGNTYSYDTAVVCNYSNQIMFCGGGLPSPSFIAYDFNGNKQWSRTTNTVGIGRNENNGNVFLLSGDGSMTEYDQYGNELNSFNTNHDDTSYGGAAYPQYGDRVFAHIQDGSFRYTKTYSIGTVDPSVTVNGDTVSRSGTTSSTFSESVVLSDGSNSVDGDTSAGEMDVSIDWTDDTRTQDPSATIDGSTVSHAGALSSGQTETGSVSISSPGSYSVSTSTSYGSATFNVDWTEVTHSEDPSLTINGTTFSHTGILSAGSTKSFTPSESLFGTTTDTLDLALTDGEVDVNFDLEIQDQDSVTIDTLPDNWSSNFSDL